MRDSIAVVHTRPADLTADVESYGFKAIQAAVMQINTIDRPIPTADYFLLTSAHAVPAAPLGTPVICVGAQTRKAAESVGLVCHSVYPYAKSLRDKGLPPSNKIIHLGGRDLSPETRKLLDENFIETIQVYEARSVTQLPAAVEQAVRAGRLGFVLCFSARAASVFTQLAECVTNKELWHNVHGLALSPRIAEAMHGLPFASVRAAAQPNRNALLEMLRDEQYK